jgi:hypothetical protein
MGNTNDADILCLRGGFSGQKIFSDGGRAEPTTNLFVIDVRWGGKSTMDQGETGSNGGRAEPAKRLFGTDVLCGARSNRTALNPFWWTCRAINEGGWIWIR